MSLSRGVLTRAPVAAGILSGVETTHLLLVHRHWDSKSSSKTGKLDQGAELSQDLALCSDSERATEGRRHRMRELLQPERSESGREHGLASEQLQTHRTACPGAADRHVQLNSNVKAVSI